MSLIFNMLSRYIDFFQGASKSLLISWLQSPSAVILEPEKIACHCSHCFPIYLPWGDGTGCHDLSFLNLSFKPAFSLCSFTFIKWLFSSFSLSAINMVSSAYLRLLIFLPAILIPACESSSLAFLMMYSAYKSNTQWLIGQSLGPVPTMAGWGGQGDNCEGWTYGNEVRDQLDPEGRPRLKHFKYALMAHENSGSEHRKPSLWEVTYTDYFRKRTESSIPMCFPHTWEQVTSFFDMFPWYLMPLFLQPSSCLWLYF